ncbi:SdpI family protein [Bacillus cereus group sp. BfR-BA-01316]|uniref:SdpI family protein n=1 Tax=Bacillus cereus group sp. BfR-BA-01316 TaxID=2920293 RepID=UPI001F579F08|nr:SdpI family protein [Bacillus cereus group sp. BfR-BA-01316]
MRKHVFPLLLIALTIIVWCIAWPYLPEEVPSHWNVAGEVDGHMSKMGMMIFDIAIMVFIYALLTVLPMIDPKHGNYDKFSKGYKVMNYSVLFVLFLVNIIGIGAGLGYQVLMNSTPYIIVGLLFIVIGNYLPQCKPNYFVGIKTPWTLSNEEVWRKTHRFSGKVFVVLGVVMMLSSFAPVAGKSFLVIGIIIGAVGLTMGYSYVAYKKEIGS